MSDSDTQAAIPTTISVIQQGIDRGLHHGMQLYVSRHRETVVDVAIGTLDGETPLTTDTLMLWLSSGKPITAVAVMQQVERGKIELDAPVADYLPEFAVEAKSSLTIRHLLTHTAGLKPTPTGWPHQSWDEILDRVCRTPLIDGWVPGERAAYDPARTWFVLAEIVQRVDGRPIAELIRGEICEPAGMDESWMAMPHAVYEENKSRIGIMHSLQDGKLRPTAGHREAACTRPSPGGSMRGPARELGKFYEALLPRQEGAARPALLKPESYEQMTSRVREGLHDETFQHQLDFGLGVIIDSNHYGRETVPYGFGRHSSSDAFGHGGAQSSIGFADPEHDLVVVAVANGSPGEPRHQKRFRELLTALYRDLGVADEDSQ